MTPADDTPWNNPTVVEGFVRSPPNARLVAFADASGARPASRILDIGCGAGRNAVPLAQTGARVVGIDRSASMLLALAGRPDIGSLRLGLAIAAMDALPIRDASVDLAVAHGIWNLAPSGDEFRRAVREAARALRPGGALFVFTFSRNTLPPDALPVPEETFVFTQFSGRPQCFLTREQLIGELAAAGLILHPGEPLLELNRPDSRQLQASRAPVIYEGVFRKG